MNNTEKLQLAHTFNKQAIDVNFDLNDQTKNTLAGAAAGLGLGALTGDWRSAILSSLAGGGIGYGYGDKIRKKINEYAGTETDKNTGYDHFAAEAGTAGVGSLAATRAGQNFIPSRVKEKIIPSRLKRINRSIPRGRKGLLALFPALAAGATDPFWGD